MIFVMLLNTSLKLDIKDTPHNISNNYNIMLSQMFFFRIYVDFLQNYESITRR